jgi:two-component system OmpR family sensor kinase
VLVSQLDDGRLLVVAAPLTPLNDALHTVGRVLLLVAIGGSIVMAVIVTLVTGYVTRPLEGMITTAQGIGSGDLDTRIPVRGVDDVAKLSSALNAMLDRLERAFADKEASEEKLRQFVADASHELRTPLSAVLGYAQLVQTGMASTPDQVGHAVGRIAAEGERMRMIVEELLMLARLDHGRAANPTRVNLADIAQVAVDDARAIVPDRPVAMHRGDVEPAALDVLADAPTVRQAIDNLLANARAHTPDGTHVEVTVERRGGGVAVVVDDDGPGIDPADAAHLFDRFFRSEGSRARPGGSGLGLSIVAAVAAAHDGSVTADRSPTGGARFTLTLPAVDQTSRASTTDHRARVRSS